MRNENEFQICGSLRCFIANAIGNVELHISIIHNFLWWYFRNTQTIQDGIDKCYNITVDSTCRMEDYIPIQKQSSRALYMCVFFLKFNQREVLFIVNHFLLVFLFSCLTGICFLLAYMYIWHISYTFMRIDNFISTFFMSWEVLK